MPTPTYIVEILDSALQPITRLAAFVPLNGSGDILEYTNQLSNVGSCRFRIATLDPIFKTYPNLLSPWSNHIRITRNGAVAWQGFIYNSPHRNRRYIEVQGATYLEEFRKTLVRHGAPQPDGTDTRQFDSGTIASVLTTILNEAKANATGRKIQSMTLGQIDNPAFPPGFTDINRHDISGQPWTFSSDFFLRFDFKDLLYVVNALAMYSKYDFNLDSNLVFTFVKRIGSDKPELVFEFAQYGMIEDFNAPLDGKNQTNHILALAADNDTKLLKLDVPRDQASIDKYGILDGVAAFADAKNINVLQSRLSEQLRLDSTPDAELSVQLNERAYPLGQYILGDNATFRVNYGGIHYDGLRQIVGVTTKLHNVGKETITLKTNKPRTYS